MIQFDESTILDIAIEKGTVDGPFGSNLPASDYTSSGVPVIRGANLSLGQERFKNNNYVYVSEATAERLQRCHCKAGDIIFTKKGTLGQTGIVPELDEVKSWIISSNQMRVRIDQSKANPLYIYYFVSSKYGRDRIIADAMTAGIPKINLTYLRKFIVLHPELECQNKIAAILSAYDDLIENNKRRISLLGKMAEEIYREWFVRFRFLGYKNAEFEKGVPKGWGEGTLGDIANMIMGQSPKSEFYNTQGEGLPFHQGVGSYGNRFPINNTYCSVSGRMANVDDVLFSVRAPVGRLNIANTKMIIGRGLAALSHKKGFNSYLFYLLKVAFSNEDIIGNGAIFNSVGKDELKGFKIFLPDKKLVEEFENEVSKIDMQIKLLLQSQANLEKTKNMLLPRLISGKLLVESLNIQFPLSMRSDDMGALKGT